jgi:hypothetical protein
MKRNIGRICFLFFLIFIVNGLFPQDDYDEYYIHRYNFYDRDYINFHIYADVLLKQFYGPPNYGETPEEDIIEYHYILKLYDPITFSKGMRDDVIEITIEEIQLIFNNEEMIKIIDLNWRGHVVWGKLYFSETGHHHTPLIMVVDRINLNG